MTSVVELFFEKEYSNTDHLLLHVDAPDGIYMLTLISDAGEAAVTKLIKQTD